MRGYGSDGTNLFLRDFSLMRSKSEMVLISSLEQNFRDQLFTMESEGFIFGVSMYRSARFHWGCLWPPCTGLMLPLSIGNKSAEFGQLGHPFPIALRRLVVAATSEKGGGLRRSVMVTLADRV